MMPEVMPARGTHALGWLALAAQHQLREGSAVDLAAQLLVTLVGAFVGAATGAYLGYRASIVLGQGEAAERSRARRVGLLKALLRESDMFPEEDVSRGPGQWLVVSPRPSVALDALIGNADVLPSELLVLDTGSGAR
jgi:hypothetical protein